MNLTRKEVSDYYESEKLAFETEAKLQRTMREQMQLALRYPESHPGAQYHWLIDVGGEIAWDRHRIDMIPR